MSLKDKVILVVGSTSGIGEQVAIEAAKEGAKVVVSGRRNEKGKEVVSKIKANGGTAEFVKCDARNEDEVKALIEKIVSLFGRLDCAFNNAGINPGFTPIEAIEKEKARNLIESNLESVIWCMKYELAQMKKQENKNGAPSIVNNGTSLVGRPVGYMGLYTALKAAVISLSEVAAIENSPHIRVNVVNPGAVRGTELLAWTGQKDPLDAYKDKNLLKRSGEVADIAKAVVFLLSDNASWTTGTSFRVDGGMTLC